MFKVVLKNKINFVPFNFINKTSFKLFSTSSANVYPDQIIENLKNSLKNHHLSLSQWADVESDIIENIHFFDTDQYVDTVSLLATANKGSEMLWDLLSKKIFDHELDLAQTYFLDEALNKCNKHDYFIADPIAINNLTYDLKWPQESKIFNEKLL